jgi:hypothetical protein
MSIIQNDLVKPGHRTAIMDPTTAEAIRLNNLAVDFMKDLDRNPKKAKQDFNAVILPFMMRAIKTTQILDEHLEAADFQIKALMKANVVMIDLLKKHSIDMPNFAEILADAEKERSTLQG